MSITSTVENDTIRLPAGVHVADGTKVEITLPEEAAPDPKGRPLDRMAEFVGCLESLPPDAAERHTNYAHGRKRQIL